MAASNLMRQGVLEQDAHGHRGLGLSCHNMQLLNLMMPDFALSVLFSFFFLCILDVAFCAASSFAHLPFYCF